MTLNGHLSAVDHDAMFHGVLVPFGTSGMVQVNRPLVLVPLVPRRSEDPLLLVPLVPLRSEDPLLLVPLVPRLQLVTWIYLTKQHWIGIILFSHTAGTAYSALEPGDEEHRLYPLIASCTPSGRSHISDDRNNDRDCQVRGYSSALASVIALQPTSALIPTPSSDDSNIQRRKLCCCWRRAPNGTFRSADISIEAHVMRLSRRQCLAPYLLRLVRPTIRQRCQLGAKVLALLLLLLA